jgi:hypothetical protein
LAVAGCQKALGDGMTTIAGKTTDPANLIATRWSVVPRPGVEETSLRLGE